MWWKKLIGQQNDEPVRKSKEIMSMSIVNFVFLPLDLQKKHLQVTSLNKWHKRYILVKYTFWY